MIWRCWRPGAEPQGRADILKGRPQAEDHDTEGHGERHRMSLEIQNLHVRIEEREILRGLSLVVRKGETHALMGPNGSGKSTLANTIMGNPAYEVTEGKILFDGEDLTEADPDERARAGLFMAFQYPATIPGVSVANFLRMAVNAKREEPIKVKEFGKLLGENMELLRIDRAFTSRYLNEGFSGGEKKRAEILQLAMLKPEIAVLDETDSGLDIDALRIVSDGVNALSGPDMGSLIITHYTRILHYVKPDFVHIMLDGRIVREGGPELADELEEKGYDFVRAEVAAADAG
jgi:Fe-S cluster assembly ATP-binding protein